MTEAGETDTGAPTGKAARELLAHAEQLLGVARAVLSDHTRAVEAIHAELTPILDSLIRRELAAIPVSRLKDVTEGRLRIGAVEQAGYTTVGQVHEANRYELRQIPGVGAQTADQALAAAGQIAHAVRDTVAVRIDVEAPDESTTALITALHRLVEAGPDVRRAVDAARRLVGRLEPLLRGGRAGPRAAAHAVLRPAGPRDGARRRRGSVRTVVADAAERGLPLLFGQVSVDLLRAPESDVAAWVDFELRSAEYYSLLAEVSGTGPDRHAAEGFLPSRIADRVRGSAARRRAPAGLAARLPVVRRPFRARPEAGDPRRRDGARQDRAGHRRARASLGAGRDALPGGVPGERADQLDAGGPGPLHAAGPAGARPRAAGGVRRVARARRGRPHHVRRSAHPAGRPGRREAARHAGRRRGPLRQEPGHPPLARGVRLGRTHRSGALPDRYADGEPRRGVPQPGPPSPARTGPVHQHHRMVSRVRTPSAEPSRPPICAATRRTC